MLEGNASSFIPLINSKVSLVTNCNARYIGTVSEVDRDKQTITLENVRIADGQESYEFIVFLISGIKEIEAINAGHPLNDAERIGDSAVVKSHKQVHNNVRNNNQRNNNQRQYNNRNNPNQQQRYNNNNNNGYNNQNNGGNMRRNGNNQRQQMQEKVVILDPVSQKRIEINVKGNQPLQQVLKQVEPLLHDNQNRRGYNNNGRGMGQMSRQNYQQNRRRREEWQRGEKQQALKVSEKLIDATQTLNKIRKNQVDASDEQKKVKEAWFACNKQGEEIENVEPSYKSQDFYDKISRPTKAEESDQRLQNSNTQARINNATFGYQQQQQRRQQHQQQHQQQQQRHYYNNNNFNRGYNNRGYNQQQQRGYNNNNRRQPESYREGDQFFNMLEKLNPTTDESSAPKTATTSA